MKREDINSKYKWNLKRIYKNQFEIDKDEESVNKLLSEIVLFKGVIMDSSNNLLNLLNSLFKVNELCRKLLIYSNLNYNVEINNTNSKVLLDKCMNLFNKKNSETSFILSEILESDHSLVEKYLNENSGLKVYEKYLTSIFSNKKHILEDTEEKVLSKYDKTVSGISNVFNSINNCLEFEDILVNKKNEKLTYGNWLKFLEHKNQDVRKQVHENMHRVYKQFNSALGSNYLNFIESNKAVAELKGYSSIKAMCFERQGINEEIIDNLINAVKKRLPSLHRYMNVKKSSLNINEMNIYDKNIKISNYNKEYSYEEAVNIIKMGLKPLGEEYLSDLDYIFDNRLIDVYESEGKISQAYCNGVYGGDKFISLNFRSSFSSIKTLSHEIGHSINLKYIDEFNPYVYSFSTPFTGEVASTVNEVLLNEYLMRNTTDKAERLMLLEQSLNNIMVTLFERTMYAEFECEATRKDVVDVANLNETYFNLMKEYHGDGMNYNGDEKYAWTTVPHYYRPFYIFTYATGICIAYYIADRIINGDNLFKDKYMEFLHTGSDVGPVEMIQELGIDLSDSEYINRTIDIFDKYLDDFEKTR